LTLAIPRFTGRFIRCCGWFLPAHCSQCSDYGLVNRRVLARFPEGARDLSFSQNAQTGPWPTHPPVQTVPGVKRPGCYAGHSPPFGSDDENWWNYTSTPPYAFMACTGAGVCLPLHFTSCSGQLFATLTNVQGLILGRDFGCPKWDFRFSPSRKMLNSILNLATTFFPIHNLDHWTHCDLDN